MPNYRFIYKKDLAGEKQLHLVDDQGKDAPPAYTYKCPDKTVLDITYPKLVPVQCTQCPSHTNVFALVMMGEVRVMCVRCLGEYASRFLSQAYR